MELYQPGAWGLYCLHFKTTKVQVFLYYCNSTLFPLLGFCFFKHTLLVF